MVKERPLQSWYLKLPMWITWGRVFTIPLFLWVYFYPFPGHLGWATFLFGVAAFTDWLDGYFARKWQVESALGAFLDPVADKLLVTTALILLAARYHDNLWILLAIVAIVLREVYISALRDWVQQMGIAQSLKVSWIGKFKTAAQLVAITWLIYGSPLWGIDWLFWGFWMLIASAVLSIWSMLDYTYAAMIQFKQQ